MKILILGGTGFVGRILTENLISSGLKPVLFNRGKRNPDIFPELRKIKGDRGTDDIKKISADDWDSVVDFSGMFPDNIDLITDMLRGKAGRYIFISSANVYVMEDEAKLRKPVKEDFEVYPCSEEQRKDKDVIATYPQKKAECERVLLSKEWLDAIVFRPALIYGRYDPTDRFYYWLYRAKFENEILVPDDGLTKSTSTYCEDFAKIIERSLSVQKHDGVYNAVTHDPVTIKDIINAAAKVLNTSPKLINAAGKFLAEKNVQPWADIPLWLGGPHLMLDNAKVKKDFGISFKSFEDSVNGCVAYYSSLGWQVPKYGLTLEREKELIGMFRNNI